jgi:hypothetical protein
MKGLDRNALGPTRTRYDPDHPCALGRAAAVGGRSEDDTGDVLSRPPAVRVSHERGELAPVEAECADLEQELVLLGLALGKIVGQP